MRVRETDRFQLCYGELNSSGILHQSDQCIPLVFYSSSDFG